MSNIDARDIKINALPLSSVLIAAGDTLEVAMGKVLSKFLAQTPGTAIHLGSFGTRRIAGFGSRPANNTNLSDGIVTQETSRIRYKAIGNIFDLAVVYGSSAEINQPAATTTGDITLTAALEYPSGTFTQITFNNGSTSIVLRKNNRIVTDNILVDIPDAADFWIRTCVTVTAGVIYPKFWASSSTYTEGVVQGSDATMSGTITNSTTFTFAPTAIIGCSTTNKGVIILIGDSLAAGQNDVVGTPNPNNYGGGILGRAIAQSFPSLACQIAGQTVVHWINNKARLTSLFSLCNFFICELGINDMRGVDTQATIQANYITMWDLLSRGTGVYGYQTTITPNTTSTDSWATTTNQTPYNTNNCNTKRIAINNWIRDGAPINVNTRAAVATGDSAATTIRAGDSRHPLLGYFEVADTMETARDSGIWKAPSYTADGLHGTTTSYPLMAAAIDTTKFLLW